MTARALAVVALAAVSMQSGAAGWYDAASCPEWAAMVDKIAMMTIEQRSQLPDAYPAGPGHERRKILATAAVHYVNAGGTFDGAIRICRALEEEEST